MLNKKFANDRNVDQTRFLLKFGDNKYDIIGNDAFGNTARRRRYTLNEASLFFTDDFDDKTANIPSSVEFPASDANPKRSTSTYSPPPAADDAASSNYCSRFEDQRSLTMSEISDICLLKPSMSSCQIAPTIINTSPLNGDEDSYTMTSSVSAPCLHGKFPSEEKLDDNLDEFSTVTRPSNSCLLSPPETFGDGNPFMLFVCLTLLLQHRDVIMRNKMDFNEIAVYFDKLVRKHKVHRVLKRARIYFADYLKSNWFDHSTK